MTFLKALALSLLAGGLSYGSSLAVYQDSTFYHFSPQNNFIGFSKGLKAKCEGTLLALSPTTSCPEDNRLCKMLSTLKSTELKLQAVQENSKILDRLVSLPQPATLDASAWINAAKLTGEAQANLLSQEQLLNEELIIKQNTFDNQAPSKQALLSSQTCAWDIELSIPYGYVSFSISYDADIIDEKEVRVTQNLSIINRSGIDIQVDTAMFYYRKAHQYIRPIHFNPWIVSKYVPSPKREYKSRAMQKELSMDMAVMAEESIPMPMMTAPTLATYEDAREYKIQNLILPSSAIPLEVEILTWKVPLSCEIRVYPYKNSRAFHVCSFKPKYQIDSNRWKVKSADALINENAVGEYRDGRYNLYTKVEEEINIVRKPIVKKERETGLFGTTVRKKDGFILTLTNKSDSSKTLTLIERIPTSTSEEVKVRLLKIDAKIKVDYKMFEDGQIQMKLTLAADENTEIEVLFEIAYDKDLKVSY